MKTFLILLALFSPLGFADCPELDGKFLCKAQTSSASDNYWIVSRVPNGTLWDYTMEYLPVSSNNPQTHTYTTDGVIRNYVEQVIWTGSEGTQTRDMNYTASMTCKDGKVILDGVSDVPTYGKLPFTMEHSLNAGGNLLLHWWSPGGPDLLSECLRQ